MNTRILAAIAVLGLNAPAFAHRLDEYLQATLVSIERNQLHASLRLIPGVAVSSAVIAAADANSDGVFSESEQQSYAEAVLRDLTFSEDGYRLTPRLNAVSFPSPAEMRQGMGEIHIELTADLPPGGSRRSLVVQNNHKPSLSVYLMNCLAPRTPGIEILAQQRNPSQSYYRVDYAVSNSLRALPASWRPGLNAILSQFSSVPRMFRLGMQHIAEGTDHLLFLIALLLPAPLLASRGRWTSVSGFRESLLRIVAIVSAFTIGHSLTLAAAASGLVSLPEPPVEALIAVSILISAIHAMRPIFPGREPLIAGFFGLIHGLAFASALHDLGVGFWQCIASILGFNLGIETMQLIVVAAILPSLLVLSRTRQYAIVRRAGAVAAGLAAIGWILERSIGVATPVDLLVNSVARRGAWIAAFLWGVSAASWLFRRAARTGWDASPQTGPGIARVV